MARIPTTMRAVVLEGHGGLDKLVYHDQWPTPQPKANEVLIKVAACGLNNTDVNTRTGWYSKGVTSNTTGEALDDAGDDDAAWGGSPIKFPLIQGADAVGHVIAVGADCDSDLIGKRVMVDVWQRDWSAPDNMNRCGYFGSEVNGGFADYAVVDHHNVHPIACDLTDAELATFATSYVTAENMLARVGVGVGDTVLISGASGGVGSGLIQLANRRGASTVAMCSASKVDGVRAAKPHAIIDRQPADLKAALRDAIGRDEVTVVADVVGGEIWPDLIDALARGGRYTCAGAIAGPIVSLDLRTFYLRDLTLVGATVVPVGRFGDLVGYIARGEIRPMLAATYPLKDLRTAQQVFIDKKHVGNIVVKMD